MANSVTITGIKYGTTTITASYTDGNVTKIASVSNFQVTAIPPTLSFTANSSTLTYSGSAQTIGTISYNGDGTAYYYVQKADSQPSTPAANASGWVEITSWTRTSGGTKQLDLSQTNAGTYYVFLKATGATGGNYTGVDPKQGGNKAINKRTVNVTTAPTFVSTTLTYNGSAQTLVNNNAASTSSAGTFYYYVSTSSTAPSSFSTSTWSTTRPSGTNAGDYYVWYYCLVDTTNNTAGTNTNSIKELADSKKNIGKKSVTVTAPSGSKVYDATALTKSSGATLTNQVSGHTLNSVTYGGSITNVGTTNCTVTNAKIYSGSTDVTSNYTISYVNGTLEVTARPIKVTAGSDSKIYDGTALTKNSATAEATGTNRGLVSGHSMTSCTVTGSQTAVGSSNNVPSAAVIKSGSTDVTSNYTISYVNGTLEVTVRTVTITTPAFNSTALTYNGSAQAVVNTGSCTAGGTMYYYLSTSSTAPTSFSTASGSGWSTTTPVKATNAGTYYVWYYCSVSDTTNNTGTGINTVTKVSGSKAINQKTATLTWGTKSWMYDGSAHSTTCSVSNLESGDTCTVTLSGNSITNVGSTTVTASSLSNSNYKLPSATADKSTTIEITARTVTYTADNQSKTYNGSVLTANNNATRSGNELVSGHTATITCTGEIGPGVSSGTKTLSSVVIKNGSGTDVSSNYSITKVNGTLSIVAAAVTVPTATGTEVTYDGGTHYATFPAVSGATITKYQKSLDGGSTWIDVGTNCPARVSAGTTQVKAQYTADGNHSIGGTTGGSAYSNTVTIKINPKAVTVTAGSSSRVYNGSALTNTNATATGLISGHHLHSWTCTGSQTYVGSSDNVASAATIYEGTHDGTESNVTRNYTITYTKGTLTITKATPTVTVTGVTKDYTGGSFYATAKANAIGTLYWKKGSAPTTSSNDGNVKLSTLNTATNVTYVKDNKDDFDMYWLFVPSNTDNITSGQTYSTNFTNAGGGSSDKVNLTINPRNITNVTASATAVTYNGSQQTASVTVTDSGAQITSSDYTISGNTGTYWQDGGYTITITGKNNYTGTKTINWTINKKAITVTAGSASKTYDGSALTKVDGTTAATLASGDHLHSYTNTGSQTNVGSSNNVPSAAKIYKGTHNGTESDVTSSYNITYANGTLTVSARTVTITAPTFTTGTLTYNGSEQTILNAGSCTTGGTMYYYISTSSTKPTFSTASGSGWTTTAPTKRTNVGTYYVWYYCSVSDTTNNTGTGINTVTAVSGNSRTIGQRTVTFTAPTKTNRTYTGNPQTIFASGSATSGGVMYYSSSNTDFSTSTWSTTMPYTQKTNAGTYTIYYYCYVADTANNTGTGINTKNSISATISQATGSITYTTYASLTEPCTTESRATSTMQGNRSVVIASSAATSSTNTGAAISYTTNQGWTCSGTTLTIPSGTAANTYTVVVTATVAATDNYKSAETTSTIEITVDAQVLTGITLTLAANSIAYNSTTTGTVMATYKYGDPKDITADATYTSKPTGVVTITK